MNDASEHEAGVAALNRLILLCNLHQGGSTTPIAQFLVSLYNAEYAKVDAYLLCRRLDDEHFEDVISVMRMFRAAPGQPDLQRLAQDGEKRIHRIMDEFGYSPLVTGEGVAPRGD